MFIYRFLDVNECDEALDSCDQLCVNIPGGYSCSCRNGYTFDSSTNACDAGRLFLILKKMLVIIFKFYITSTLTTLNASFRQQILYCNTKESILIF